MNVSEEKRIIITNYVLLLAAVVAFGRIFMFTFSGDTAYTLVSLLASLSFFLAYYLNTKGYFDFAKFFLLIIGNAATLVKELSSGGQGSQLYLIIAGFSIVFLLFDSRQTFKFLIALSIPLINVVISIFFDDLIVKPKVIDHDMLILEKFFGVVSATVIIVLVTWYFVKRSSDAEAGLMKSNDELKELNSEISGQKDKIEELLVNSDNLLLNVLPEPIANRLKSGEKLIADYFDEASIIFIDIADFAGLSARSKPQTLVSELNKIFTKFDKISTKYGIEKIKTIGDCYMAASGIPSFKKDHAESVAKMALEVMDVMNGYKTEEGQDINLRIGIDCGPVVAGVIGERKFIYDLWGESVNRASRMEDFGLIGKIQCTQNFKDKIMNSENHDLFQFTERGKIEIKGMGLMSTFFLDSKS